MAVFKIARDGHFFITTGEPGIIDETGSLTYSVRPRATQIFIETGFRHGQAIPKELFYALVVEGDITSGDLAPPSILSVPKAILSHAVGYEDLEGIAGAVSPSAQRAARYVIDYFQVIHDRLQCAPERALREACMYSLGGRFRQFLDQRGVLRNAPVPPAKSPAPEPAAPVGRASSEVTGPHTGPAEEPNYTSKLATRIEMLKAENAALRARLANAESKVAQRLSPQEQAAAREQNKRAFESLAREVFQSLQIMSEMMDLPLEQGRG